jgi:branched-chain amino acid transport system permease protein
MSATTCLTPAFLPPALRRELLLALGLIALLGAAILLARLSGVPYWTTLIARIAITAMAALSLSFLIGQAGLISFGQAAPVGLGAYVALVLVENGVADLALQLPLAFGLAALFALLTGLVTLRTRGVYFIMLTLAFAQMLFYVGASLTRYGGDDGMALATRSTLLGLPLLKTDTGLALVSTGLMGLILFGLIWLTHTRYGLVLKAIPENEPRVAASGFDVQRLLLVASMLAAGIAALSGVLLANQADYVSPSYMNWHRSGELIVIVVLGGAGRLTGAVIGTIAVLLFEELLGHYTEYWKLGLGLMIVTIVLLRGRDLAALVGRRA